MTDRAMEPVNGVAHAGAALGPAPGLGDTPPPAGQDAGAVRAFTAARARLWENFGRIVLALMPLPRDRHLSVAKLQQAIPGPLVRDRVSIAFTAPPAENLPGNSLGIAIWASLLDEAEARFQEQTRAGAFPPRLKPEDWTSGGNRRLPGVIAPDARSAAAVIGNFRQLVKDGRTKLHPGVLRLLVAETLKRWKTGDRVGTLRSPQGDTPVNGSHEGGGDA